MGRKSYRRVKYRKKISEEELVYGLVGVVLLLLLFNKPDLFLWVLFGIIIVLPIYRLSKVIQLKNFKIADIDKVLSYIYLLLQLSNANLIKDFEKLIQENPEDEEILIDFAEFLMNKLVQDYILI